jgi:hypothetical protein
MRFHIDSILVVYAGENSQHIASRMPDAGRTGIIVGGLRIDRMLVKQGITHGTGGE